MEVTYESLQARVRNHPISLTVGSKLSLLDVLGLDFGVRWPEVLIENVLVILAHGSDVEGLRDEDVILVA
jgi:hypothetical protein